VIADGTKIEGVDLADEEHILIDLSDGRTLKYSLAALSELPPVHIDVVVPETDTPRDRRSKNTLGSERRV
jgi:hypothetical protein